MPILRILLAAAGALLMLLVTLWVLNVNYAAWLGAWLSPENQLGVGMAVLIIFGVVISFVYAGWLGNVIPGAGPFRGLQFGAVLAAMAIWLLPVVLDGFAGVIGNTQVVYQGRGITDDEVTFDQRMADKSRTAIEPCPEIAGVAPPLAHLTADQPWAPTDGWVGRLLPFSVGFLLFGLVIGTFLSDEKRGSA